MVSTSSPYLCRTRFPTLSSRLNSPYKSRFCQTFDCLSLSATYEPLSVWRRIPTISTCQVRDLPLWSIYPNPPFRSSISTQTVAGESWQSILINTQKTHFAFDLALDSGGWIHLLERHPSSIDDYPQTLNEIKRHSREQSRAGNVATITKITESRPAYYVTRTG